MKKKIFIVDDDPSVIELLSSYLNLGGFDVYGETDPFKGLQKIKELLPEVIVCDINMPELNGFELLKKIKKVDELRNSYIIMLTSHDTTDFKIRGLELGADDYITKPFQRAEVLARIRAAMRKLERQSDNEIIGDLSQMTLVDIFQFFELNKKSGIIDIPTLNAKIRVSNGLITFLNYKIHDPYEALLRMLLLNKGFLG